MQKCSWVKNLLLLIRRLKLFFLSFPRKCLHNANMSFRLEFWCRRHRNGTEKSQLKTRFLDSALWASLGMTKVNSSTRTKTGIQNCLKDIKNKILDSPEYSREWQTSYFSYFEPKYHEKIFLKHSLFIKPPKKNKIFWNKSPLNKYHVIRSIFENFGKLGKNRIYPPNYLFVWPEWPAHLERLPNPVLNLFVSDFTTYACSKLLMFWDLYT